MLVKRLVTIEDLGNIEVLFTDKTGTLTHGAITFDQSLDPAGRPATWPLLLGLVCNEATITEHGPIGGNALDVALWSAPAAQPLAADATGGPRAYQRLGLAPVRPRPPARLGGRTHHRRYDAAGRQGRTRGRPGPLRRGPTRHAGDHGAAVRRRRPRHRRRHPRRP